MKNRNAGLTALPLALIVVGFAVAGWIAWTVRSAVVFRNRIVALDSPLEGKVEGARAALLAQSPDGVNTLLEIAQDADAPASKRTSAIRALGILADPAGGRGMISFLVREAKSGSSLSARAARDALQAMARRAPDDRAFRQELCLALIDVGAAQAAKGAPEQAVPLLAQVAALPCPPGRLPDAVERLQGPMLDESPSVRTAAVEAVGASLCALRSVSDEQQEAIEKGLLALVQATRDGHTRVRKAADGAFARWDASTKAQALVRLLSNPVAQGDSPEAFWVRYYGRMELERTLGSAPPVDPYDASGPAVAALDGWWAEARQALPVEPE